MKSLTSEEDILILRTEEREKDGCLYRYCLQGTANAPGSNRYLVHIGFCAADGYTTEQTMPLPFSDGDKAVRLFERIVSTLVTPIDLPYVLEDCFAV